MADTVFEMKNGTLTVRPAGGLDSVTSPAFEEELRGKLESADHIVFDLEQVNYVSSAGLRVFLAAEQRAEKQDADMKLIHVNDYIREIFDMVGLSHVITIE